MDHPLCPTFCLWDHAWRGSRIAQTTATHHNRMMYEDHFIILEMRTQYATAFRGEQRKRDDCLFVQKEAGSRITMRQLAYGLLLRTRRLYFVGSPLSNGDSTVPL